MSYLEYEELGEYAENPTKFIWTKLFTRKFPGVLEGDTIGKMKESMKKMMEFGIVESAETVKKLKEEHNVVPFAPSGIGTTPLMPADELINTYRGIKNSSRDMRKDPQYYEEVMEKMAKSLIEPVVEAINNGEWIVNRFRVFGLFPEVFC